MKRKKIVSIVLAVILTGLTGCAGLNVPDVNDIAEFVDEVAEEKAEAEEEMAEAQEEVSEEIKEAMEEVSEEVGEAMEEASEEVREAQEEAASEVSDAMDEASGEVKEALGQSAGVNIPESELSSQTIRFTSETLDGQPVTEEIFKDHDITIVHVWGTFCGPCIREMGEYASFYEELPDNVGLVGMVCDVYEGDEMNVDDANEILSDAGAKFMNLRTSESLYNLTSSLGFVPSSFFVDREGHVIGEMMDGAGFEETKARLNTYLK